MLKLALRAALAAALATCALAAPSPFSRSVARAQSASPDGTVLVYGTAPQKIGVFALRPVVDKDLSAPPSSPTAGTWYIVDDGPPTGLWALHAGHLARYTGSGWAFTVPVAGSVAWVADESLIYTYDGTEWAAIQGGGGGGGSGDVVGPASATDNAVVRFNGSSGTSVQNSAVTIADTTGSITLPAGGTVDGRDVSVDGATLDAHVASTSNPHSVTVSQLGTATSAQLATVLSDETGSAGGFVRATSPTLTTPALGTPSALVLTNATGLPLTTGITGTLAVANGGTGATTASAAVDALFGASSSGTGGACRLTNCTLTTPTIASFVNALHSHQNAAGGGTLDTAALASGTLATARLGSGTANSSTFLRGDSTWTSVPGGGDALTSSPLSQFASTTSAELAGVLSDETGSGAFVLATSPTLVTPALGTPSAATLTNATGLPISTGVSGLGTGVATALATPSSANLRSAITDETGTGAAVFATSPALVTPDIGTPSAATLTNATGLPISTGVSGLGTGVATALATPSSANLAAAVTNETGSGALVFGTSPALTTPDLGTPSAATLTNATGLPLDTGVTGTLPVANGGTGSTSASVALSTLGGLPLAGGTLTGPVTLDIGSSAFSGTVSLDTATHDSYVVADITSDFTLTLTNAAAGKAGTIYLEQDGTGGWDMTSFAITGATLNHLGGSLSTVAGERSEITFACYTDSTLFCDYAIGAPGAGGGDALTSNGLGQFASTTSAELATVLSDETGSGGGFVRATSPTIATPTFSGTASGSITGNAGTVTIQDAGGDTTTFPALATSATGALGPTTDAELTYNATTNALSATTFVGALTGNADTATSATSATTATTATNVADADKGAISIASGVWGLDASTVGSSQITDGAVANADLADVATATIKGRTTAGTGVPEDLTATQATAILDTMVGDTGTGGTKGLVPAPATGDATKYLRGDATWQTIAGGGDALTTDGLDQFAATTSAELAGVLSDETGSSGGFVRAGSPTFTGAPVLADPTATTLTLGTAGLHLLDTDATHDLVLTVGSNLTADRAFTLITGDSARTLQLDADTTVTTTAATVLDDTSTSAMRTTLGLGSLATLSTVTTSEITDGTIASADIASDAVPTNFDRQRVLQALCFKSGDFVVTSGRTYAVYLGYVAQAKTIKYVEFVFNTNGAGTQTAEVALASSGAPPNKGSQSLTKLTADGTLDDLTTGATNVKRNTTAFNSGSGYTVAAGTYLWALFRSAMGATQPRMVGCAHSWGLGFGMTADAVGALTSMTSATFAPATGGGTTDVTYLWATMD